MLISQKHKLIIIDIPILMGTTSINNALSRFMQENDFNLQYVAQI